MQAFTNYHPFVLFVYFATIILFSMFFMHPIYLGISLGFSITFLGVLKGGSFLKKNLFFSIPLFLIIAISNPLFSHRGVTPLFYINYNPVTLESVLYGFAMATMILSVIFWFNCYSEIMTTDKFICLFGPIVPSIALVISMTLRLVPKFKHQIKLISNAQKTLGMYVSSGSIIQRIKSGIRILSILITWALENAIETADSMKARGYGLKPRTNYSLFQFTRKDASLLGFLIFLNFISLWGEISSNSLFYYYPYLTKINLSPLNIFLYISYALLMALPIIIEMKEEIQWRLLISKI